LKKRTLRVVLLAACAAAAALGAFLYLRLAGPWLTGGPARLVEAPDERGSRVTPPAGREGTPRPALALSPLYAGSGKARISDVAYRIELGGSTRSSLVCLAPTRIVYKVVVPPRGRLRFALGRTRLGPVSAGEASPASSRLTISAGPPFGRTRTIFTAAGDPRRTDAEAEWEEVSVALDEYSGRKVRLVFEAESSPRGSPPGLVFYVADPVLAPDAPPSPDRPNIIIVAADALRPDHLGCYGYARPTSPAIDRFSREAVLFENAVSQAPWTLPSFASFFTSLYPSFHGATANETRLVPGTPTLTGLLVGAGYTAMASVRNMFLFPRYGFSEGFDVFYRTGGTTERQLGRVNRWLESGPRRPLFLFYHLLVPHAPYDVPAPFAGAFSGPGTPSLDASNRGLKRLEESPRLPGPAGIEELRARYDERVLYLDSLVEGMLAEFKRLGLYDDSLIVFLSDHGEQFGEHGHLTHAHTLYQEEVRIPFIVKWPRGRGPAGLRVGPRVAAIDIAATILDELGISPPPGTEGRSLRPLLEGKSVPGEVIFSELNFLGRTAAFKGPYKYIATDPAAYAEGMKTHGSRRRRALGPGPLEELYDLDRDPGEKHNLIADRPDLAGMFRREMAAFAGRAAAYRRRSFNSSDANKITLDASEKEKLRALGYLK
jgi:choline-sulfatase